MLTMSGMSDVVLGGLLAIAGAVASAFVDWLRRRFERRDADHDRRLAARHLAHAEALAALDVLEADIVHRADVWLMELETGGRLGSYVGSDLLNKKLVGEMSKVTLSCPRESAEALRAAVDTCQNTVATFYAFSSQTRDHQPDHSWRGIVLDPEKADWYRTRITEARASVKEACQRYRRVVERDLA